MPLYYKYSPYSVPAWDQKSTIKSVKYTKAILMAFHGDRIPAFFSYFCLHAVITGTGKADMLSPSGLAKIHHFFPWRKPRRQHKNLDGEKSGVITATRKTFKTIQSACAPAQEALRAYLSYLRYMEGREIEAEHAVRSLVVVCESRQ